MRGATRIDVGRHVPVPERTALMMPAERYRPLPDLAGLYDPRACLAAFIGIPAAPLVVAAAPGMAITAAAAWSLTLALRKIKIQTGRVLANVLQR